MDAQVTFSDGSSCTVISSTDVELQCEVDGFVDDSSGRRLSTITLTIDVNGENNND